MMDLQGKVIAALPERSGVSSRGEWKAQDFVLETHESFPHKMVFSVFGAERLQRFNIQVGQEVMVSFDIDAHEYNGRWFNSIRAFDVRMVDPASVGSQGTQSIPAASTFDSAPTATQQGSTTTSEQTPFPPQQPTAEKDSADDLPF